MRELLLAFVYAARGIRHMLRQRNARIHIAAAIAVVGLAALLGVSALEWALLMLAIGCVLTAEAINTAIEAVVDVLSPEKREAARIAKDTAAGAVLFSAIAAAAVGAIIFGPHLWRIVVRASGT